MTNEETPGNVMQKDNVGAFGIPVDRRVRRLQRKLEKRNAGIAGLRIGQSEAFVVVPFEAELAEVAA